MSPAPNLSPQGRMIAIASGKGGVGKTWLSVTLAQALAQAGRRVLLVDADLGLANVDVQLGLDPRQDLSAVLAGRLTPRQAAVRHDAGFDILPGRSGSGALASLDDAAITRMIAALEQARQDWQEVILDLGAGLEPSVRRLAAAADTLLVVATDEPTSLTDAYAVLKLHRQDAPRGDARLVVNQAQDRSAGDRTWRTLQRAMQNFLQAELPLAGIIRRDAKVPDSIRKQTPLLTRHPNATAAQDVTALARGMLLDLAIPAS